MRERFAGHVLHGHEELAVELAEGVDVNDIRMGEKRSKPRLAQKHLLAPCVGRGLRKQALQRDDSLESSLALLKGYFDGAHASAPNQKERPVAVLDVAARGAMR